MAVHHPDPEPEPKLGWKDEPSCPAQEQKDARTLYEVQVAEGASKPQAIFAPTAPRTLPL